MQCEIETIELNTLSNYHIITHGWNYYEIGQQQKVRRDGQWWEESFHIPHTSTSVSTSKPAHQHTSKPAPVLLSSRSIFSQLSCQFVEILSWNIIITLNSWVVKTKTTQGEEMMYWQCPAIINQMEDWSTNGSIGSYIVSLPTIWWLSHYLSHIVEDALLFVSLLRLSSFDILAQIVLKLLIVCHPIL